MEQRVYDRLKSDALEIYKEAVHKMFPHRAIKENIRINGKFLIFGFPDSPVFKQEISSFNEIYIFAVGKAAFSMTESALDALNISGIKEKIRGGVVITKDGHSGKKDLSPLQVFEASHPVPDERGLRATEKIINMLKNTGEKDLVLLLISGGGSALFEALPDGISLDDLGNLTEILLTCGADIKEINTIRKKISLVKGGKTASLAYPSTVVSLILSDVLGSPPEYIASGPTEPDSGTFADAMKILDKYKIRHKIPVSIREYLESGLNAQGENETAIFENTFNNCFTNIIGDNISLTAEAKKIALSKGYNSMILTNWIRGEARSAGEFFASIAMHIEQDGDFPVKAPCCIIAGGEPVVVIKGNGTGGRCQEAALSFTSVSGELNNSLFLAAGSDGTDGPTDAAGGIGCNETLRRGREKDLDISLFLNENDSYNYLKKTDGLIITGPSGTNVNDLFLLLVGKK